MSGIYLFRKIILDLLLECIPSYLNPFDLFNTPTFGCLTAGLFFQLISSIQFTDLYISIQQVLLFTSIDIHVDWYLHRLLFTSIGFHIDWHSHRLLFTLINCYSRWFCYSHITCFSHVLWIASTLLEGRALLWQNRWQIFVLWLSYDAFNLFQSYRVVLALIPPLTSRRSSLYRCLLILLAGVSTFFCILKETCLKLLFIFQLGIND